MSLDLLVVFAGLLAAGGALRGVLWVVGGVLAFFAEDDGHD